MLWFLLFLASSSSSCIGFVASTARRALGQQRSVWATAAAGQEQMCFSERKGERKACGRKSGGMGRERAIRPRFSSAACRVSLSVCAVLCFLQAAAEPVATGSVYSSLHSAWRLPARGLTFPEVLSHSASCYSP